jgi:uncharacterized RDD family membrane protein YckC
MDASKKRIVAGFIDLVITSLVQTILMFTMVLLPVMQGTKSSENMMIDTLIISLASLSYLIIRDILGQKSIGKLIMQLNVVDNRTSQNASFLQRFLRNITWFLGPIEIIFFIVKRSRIGDIIAKTSIVSNEILKS